MNQSKSKNASIKRESELALVESSYHPKKTQIIQDPGIIKIFDHDRMKEILNLVYENDLTIMEISEKMDINPGSIKRYIDKLVAAKLIMPSKIEMNKYHIKLKYYRISALNFEFVWQWPSKNSIKQ